MAFLKNRTASIMAICITILAAIGIIGSLISNPAGFLQRIAVIVLIVAAVYFLFRRFYQSSPEKQEQRAFVKAAKKSKKRLHHKDGGQNKQRANVRSLASLRKNKATKKHPSHLTVIEGKKGKKKDRATF
ncbi:MULTISPECIES: SA1362 family protein [Bacillus]|uniref:SA1362 family protein n=1 Tax=Bacillus TaxID=1386 RepID=UPI001FE5B97F|nr:MULTISPECIES: SA1362 family protein [Bacillus]